MSEVVRAPAFWDVEAIATQSLADGFNSLLTVHVLPLESVTDEMVVAFVNVVSRVSTFPAAGAFVIGIARDVPDVEDSRLLTSLTKAIAT